jgi:hypothetical protein
LYVTKHLHLNQSTDTLSQGITALVRAASVDKPVVVEYSRRGVNVKTVDLSTVSDDLVEALIGMDVVIDCMTLSQTKEEIVLIEASSKAKVGRFVPSLWGPACPPRGVMFLREKVSITPYLILKLVVELRQLIEPIERGSI